MDGSVIMVKRDIDQIQKLIVPLWVECIVMASSRRAIYISPLKLSNIIVYTWIFSTIAHAYMHRHATNNQNSKLAECLVVIRLGETLECLSNHFVVRTRDAVIFTFGHCYARADSVAAQQHA